MLTEKQWDVLSELADKKIRGSASMHMAYLGVPAKPEGGWFTPLEFGGRNGSHHSATATALAKKGWVERYKGGRKNFFESHSKGSCLYRISDKGMEVYARENSRRRESKEGT